MVRVTVNGERTQLTTNRSVAPARWDASRGRVRGRSAEAQRINLDLDMMRSRLTGCYDRIVATAEPPTPFKIKDMYLGGDIRRQTLLEFFAHCIDEFKTMVGVSRSKNTYYKYRCVHKHLAAFVAECCGCDDIPFYRIDRRFISEFHRFLGSTLGLKTNTVWIYMIAFKHIIMQARGCGLIAQNPFANYRLHSEFVSRDFLSFDEVCRLTTLDPANDTLRLVRDLFLFSCYTGLSYIDIRNLRFDNLQSIDNEMWINTSRCKTGTEVGVRLLDVPLSILSRRSSPACGGRIFSVPSNGHCNRCLQKIMKLAGIERHITFHAARHTFATSITLGQGVGIETISKLLGHKNIRTTQIYASVTHSCIRSEMERLQKRIAAERCAAIA